MKKSKAPSVAWPTVDDPTDIEIAAAIRLARSLATLATAVRRAAERTA